MAPLLTPYTTLLLSSDGTTAGILSVSSTAQLRKGATVYLSSAAQANKTLIIDAIISSTQVAVRDPSVQGTTRFNCSAYLVADGAVITQPQQTDFLGQSQLGPQQPSSNPEPLDYITVRLSDGSNFYNASSGSAFTANQGAPGTLANGWPVKITDGTNVLGTALNPIKIDGSGVIQPVSGTVAAIQSGPWTVAATQSGSWTVLQGSPPWADNITQFGGNSVVTGTGASGVGIPRVTVSNDSNILATQSGLWTVAGTGIFNTSDAHVTAGGPLSVELSDGATFYVAAKTGQLPAALDGSGFLKVHEQGIATVTGTVAATQSGGWTVSQGSPPWTQNITQFGGNNVVTGTGASGVGIPRVTVSNDSNILATQSGTWTVAGTGTFNTSDSHVTAATPLSVELSDGAAFYAAAKTGQLPAALDGSGFLKVHEQGTATIAGTVTANQGGSWTVLQGSPPWTQNITQFGGNNVVTGTGVSGVGIPRVTVSNDSNVLATQSGSWTVVATQSGSWAVTANAGTNLNTSALALDTSVNGILLTQGSSTSGEKGPLVQGAVTTSAPSYSNNQTSPLSLTPAGALRVDGSGVTQPVSGTVSAIQAADVVNAGNSTTAILTANSVFTGTAIDFTATPIAKITVQSFSDVASAQGGLQIQYSIDNVHWDHATETTAPANNSASVSGSAWARYARVVYTNGTTNQTLFRLQTILSVFPDGATIKDLDTPMSSDDNALVCRSILTGKSSLPEVGFTDVQTDIYGNLQVAIGGTAADAFQRIRVAEPVALFNSQFQYDTQPLLFQTSVSGTGSVVKTAGESSLTLSTGGGLSGATAINQTKMYFRYQPGKSQQILMTGILGAQKTNVRSRMGYFDVNDGVYFEMDGTLGASVNQRSSTSGSPVNTQILQANWNFDKFDGTGPSGVTLNFANAQIFFIDFQWLGVGRVRFGFFVGGVALQAHQINNANVVLLPYMNTANLPCRAEITNTGAAAGATTMKQICIAVTSEGGSSQPAVYNFSANNGVTSVAASGTRTPILSIRPKTTFNSIANRSQIQVQTVEILNSSSPNILWELFYNGTLTGASFSDVNATYSAVQFDVAASAITPGILISSGYVGGSSKTIVAIPLNAVLPFTLDFGGTVPDIFTLCATSFGANVNTNAIFAWQENR